MYPGVFNTYILYDMIRYTQTYHFLGTTIIKENTNEDAYNPYRYYNGIEFINDRGNVIGEYSKIKLVPGGESYPFQDNEFLLNTFPFKNIINFMYSQFDKAGANRWDRGRSLTVFNHPNGYTFSGVICFESAFGNFVRKFVYNGAQTLAVITEDAWSYSDESLLQHFYMSVFRAIENRRDIVHNGNSGVTGHISSTGKIISTLPFWKPDYMIANVALNNDITIYTRFGEWFVYLCFICICVLVFFSAAKTLSELKEIIKKRLFNKESKEETVPHSGKKVDDYINNDTFDDIPSLDDIEDAVSKKKTVEESIDYNQKKDIEQPKKETIKRPNDAKKIDVFSESSMNIDYGKEFSDIIEDSNKDYNIFDDNKFTSDIYSALSTIIEENEENISKENKKNNSTKK